MRRKEKLIFRNAEKKFRDLLKINLEIFSNIFLFRKTLIEGKMPNKLKLKGNERELRSVSNLSLRAAEECESKWDSAFRIITIN